MRPPKPKERLQTRFAYRKTDAWGCSDGLGGGEPRPYKVLAWNVLQPDNVLRRSRNCRGATPHFRVGNEEYGILQAEACRGICKQSAAVSMDT